MQGLVRLWLLPVLQCQLACAGTFLATARHMRIGTPFQPVVGQEPEEATPENLVIWGENMEADMAKLRFKFLDMRAKITRTKATMSQAAAAMMNALQQSSAIEVNLHLATLGIEKEAAAMAKVDEGVDSLSKAARLFNDTSNSIVLLPENGTAEMQEMEDGFRMLSEGGNASLRVSGMQRELENMSQHIYNAVNKTVHRELRDLLEEQRQALINLTLVTPMPASTVEPATPPC
mmetsp:Transcript_18911/g.44134  ORF Transcript_18911/g.44134 Transcript_18911/m.44134 type:complete len:233 (-) Transcript_18911:34-732(-)